MPKLSMRQLLHLAARTARRSAPPPVEVETEGPLDRRAQRYARRLHDASGRANDLWFAVVRAVNVCSPDARRRDLARPGAIAKAIGPFNALATVCSQLNALDYVLDSASFGDFKMTGRDPSRCEFKLGIVDVRRVLLRIVNTRGRLMQTVARRKEERFLRRELRMIAEPVLHNALLRYSERCDRALRLTVEDWNDLEATKELLLLRLDGDYDLLWASTADRDVTAMAYHLSLALRLNQAVAEMVPSALPAKGRAEFDDSVHLDDVLADLGREDHQEG